MQKRNKMINYDSEEEKAAQESLAEKLKQTREFLADKEKVKEVATVIGEMMEKVMDINARLKRGERITDEEKEFLFEADKEFKQLLQGFKNMQSIIEDNMIKQADAIFFNIKELAEKGDEKAKKLYEEILPKYKDALNEENEGRLN